MGMPAARLGDPTMHGGTIAVGFPMVLIGGMPAARLGDMHVCPMLNPGTPPPPHVGGPITKGSMTVLIGNQPAARQGDMATCAGPPDSIAMGCPTVLIGDGGMGGGAGGGGSDGSTGPGQQLAANVTAVGSSQANDDSSSLSADSHFLNVRFVDKAGLPIIGIGYSVKKYGAEISAGPLAGPIELRGIEAGSYDVRIKTITQARWSAECARVGETVKLQAKVHGFENGTPAKFFVFEKDFSSPDDMIKAIDATVAGEDLEAEWAYEYEEDTDDVVTPEDARRGYQSPEYYFLVQVEDVCGHSDLLEFKDYVEVTLKDGNENPIPDARYRIHLPNGEVKEGNLDGNGYVKIENVPPGAWDVEFPEIGTVLELEP